MDVSLRRGVSVMLTAVLALALHVGAAAGQVSDPRVKKGTQGDTAQVAQRRQAAAVDLVATASGSPPGPDDVGVELVIDRVDDEDAEEEPRPCWRLVVRVFDGAREQLGDSSAALGGLDQFADDSWGRAIGRCPPGQDPHSDVTVHAAIARMVEAVPMPPPDPYIAPGWAITGRLGFLETRVGEPEPITVPVLLGEVVITAEPTRVQVDWGDGRVSDHTGAGGPWPDGDIRHAWADAGTVTVRVLQFWDARWSYSGYPGVLPPASGVVQGLWSYGEIPDFRLRQLQAVRVN